MSPNLTVFRTGQVNLTGIRLFGIRSLQKKLYIQKKKLKQRGCQKAVNDGGWDTLPDGAAAAVLLAKVVPYLPALGDIELANHVDHGH